MKKFYYLTLLLSTSLLFKAQVTMLTNMPKSIAPNANIVLEIKINKGTISNFAKYQLDVPAGVTVTEGDSRTGNFTFENNRAKIVWVSIPVETEFIITMKLSAGNTNGATTFNQKFYFLDNGTKKEVESEPLSVTFDGSGATVATSLPNTTQTNTTSTTPTETTAVVVKTETTSTTATPTETTVVKTETTSTTSTPTETKTATTITPATGLVYKIQLGAFGVPPDKSKFKGVSNVQISNEAGLFKALVGNYNSKDEALKKREELIAKGFNGFIVAYQNGVRVK